MSSKTKPFGFPFEPYGIQKDFMKELYNVLDQGKIGIFESPTGTVSKGFQLQQKEPFFTQFVSLYD